MKTIISIFFLIVSFPALANAMPALINADWLAKHMETNNYYFIEVIARNSDDNLNRHIRGAVKTVYRDDGWVDHFSELPNSLPEFDELVEIAGNLGISHRKSIVIVPMKNDIYSITSAIRIYWVLKMLGIKELALLDGGFEAYQAKALPTSKRVTKPIRKLFKANIDTSYLANTDEVQQAIKSHEPIIDARLPGFFDGETKHVYVDIKGSIAGADNVPWSDMLNHNGTFKNKISLWQLFHPYIDTTANAHIVYSDTGQIAAIAWFVLSELIDQDNVKLYDEGYIMWQSIPHNPIQYLHEDMGQYFGLVY